MYARTVQCLLLMGSRVFQQSTRAMLPPLMVFMAPDLGLDTSAKGQLMTAYAVGYLITQVPGGALADRLGSKSMIFWAMFLSGATAAAMPIAAEKYGVPGFWVVRCAMGAVQGPLFPASFVHLSKWMPKNSPAGDEKAWGTQLLDIGISIGSLMIIPFATNLAIAVGWRHAFHVIGGITMVFALLWQLLASDNPGSCWYIGDSEKKFIADSMGEVVEKPKVGAVERGRDSKADKGGSSRSKSPKPAGSKEPPVSGSKTKAGPEGGILGMPFSLIMHPACWAIFVSHMAFNYGAYFMTNWNSEYYEKVLKITPQAAQFHLMMPHVTNLFAKGMASFANKFVQSKGASLLTTRRIFTSFGFAVSGLIFIPIYSLRDANPWVSTFLFSIANACFGLAPNGFKANYLDVTEVYVGIVSAYGNLLATVMSAVGPMITAYILNMFSRWDFVHFSITALNLFAVGIFVTFSSTTPIELGRNKKKD